MELMMYLGNDLIESVTVNLTRFSEPGYLGQFKRVLKQKHSELIMQAGTPPDFLLVDIKPANKIAVKSPSTDSNFLSAHK